MKRRLGVMAAAVMLLVLGSCNGPSAHAESNLPQDRTAAAQRASRNALWDRQKRWVWVMSKCVRLHESMHAGHYKAINRAGSTASGAYQMLDSTWRSLAAHVPGASKYRRAFMAPPVVQDRVFIWAVTHRGKGNWRGTNCEGTDW